MTTTLRVALGLLLCLLLCACLLPAANADGEFQSLKAAIANGETYFEMNDCGTVVFSESILLPESLHLEAHNTEIVIPNGVTMTVEGFDNITALTVQKGGHVTVNRTDSAHLSLHDRLTYDSIDQFTIYGDMGIKDRLWTDDLRNLNLGPNAHFQVESDVDNDTAFQAAAAMEFNFPNAKYDRRIFANYDMVLSGDMDLQDFSLEVGARWSDGQSFGSLTIPAGVTLTVNANLKVTDVPIYLQGRLINLGGFNIKRENASGPLFIRSGNGSYSGRGFNVRAEDPDGCLSGFDMSKFQTVSRPGSATYYLVLDDTLAELKAAIARGDSSYTLNTGGQLSINENLTIPAGFELVAVGTDVYLNKNTVTTVNGQLRMENAHLFVDGSALTNNGLVSLSFRGDPSLGALLRISGNGIYIPGDVNEIAVQDTEANAPSYISGLDLSQFETVVLDGGVKYIGRNAFTELKAAIANGETYFNMSNRGTVAFTESITLPESLYFEAFDTKIVVPNFVTLTVKGFDHFGYLTVLKGGHVTVGDNVKANFDVHQGLSYESVDQFTVNGHMFVKDRVWTDDLRNLSLGENASVAVGSSVYNDAQLHTALTKSYNFPNNKYTKRIDINYNCTLTEDLEIYGFDLAVSGSWTDGQPSGSLTIPAGVTVRIIDKLSMDDVPLYLQGQLFNLGGFKINPDKSDGALLIRSGDGYYAGRPIDVYAAESERDRCISGFDLSTFGRSVGPGGTSYFPPADLMLPKSTKSVETDAFAGVSIQSVFFPTGVESIDPAAFGNMPWLIVYGVSGTAAETFAKDNGYLFVGTPPRYYDFFE